MRPNWTRICNYQRGAESICSIRRFQIGLEKKNNLKQKNMISFVERIIDASARGRNFLSWKVSLSPTARSPPILCVFPCVERQYSHKHTSLYFYIDIKMKDLYVKMRFRLISHQQYNIFLKMYSQYGKMNGFFVFFFCCVN